MTQRESNRESAERAFEDNKNLCGCKYNCRSKWALSAVWSQAGGGGGTDERHQTMCGCACRCACASACARV